MKEREWEKGSHRSSFQTTLSPLPPPPPPPPLRLHIHLWVCSWFNCLVRIEQIECALPDPAELTGGITGLIWRERKGGRAKKGGERDTQEERKRRRATRVRDGSREEKEWVWFLERRVQGTGYWIPSISPSSSFSFFFSPLLLILLHPAL